MDGAGFVNTDPPEDPESIVGVAGIVANDDYTYIAAGSQSIRIAPLANDELPDGATQLTIKSVSDTAQGAVVTVSEDGRHLIYTAVGDEGFRGWDSFYYIVQTENGRLGKANVQLGQKRVPSPRGILSSFRSSPHYEILEDAGVRLLNVLRDFLNYHEYEGATITSATMPEGGGSVRISDDGRGLWYQPEYAFTGRDDVEITVRSDDGMEADIRIRINVLKPYGIKSAKDDVFVERGTGPITITPLRNDLHRRAFATPPYIESATVPDYTGTISLTASGNGMVFNPAPNFEGRASVTYTVRYGEAEHQMVSGRLYASVADGYQAVENYFLIEPDSAPTELDVLANDPNYQENHGLTLRLVVVSTTSAGGQVTHNGRTISYQPAPGYEGDDTFTYTVESSSGVQQTAKVTIEVAPRPIRSYRIAQFATQRELEQYLIDRAVAFYGNTFGAFVEKYAPLPEGVVLRNYFEMDAISAYSTNASHSETNTQVDGVDEADIVETDGRYVYTLSGGKLAIIDLIDPSKPVLASLTEFETKIDKMYLQQDRLTLIHSGSPARTHYSGVGSGYQREFKEDQAVVLVLDLSDHTAPTVLERTELIGYIADSRAIDSKVHLVVQHPFEYPELGGDWIVDPIPPDVENANVDPWSGVGYVTSRGTAGVWANETLEQYLDRVRDQLVKTGLPSFDTYNAAGEVVASGLLTTPTNLYKAIGGDDLVASLLTIDTADAILGPSAEATSFIADAQTTVYVSTESAYLFAYDWQTDTTTIRKLDLSEDGTLPLVAIGEIRGKLLNPFSADEYEGRLRVATTQQERQYLHNGRSWRQRRLFNNLQVIEQDDGQLKVIGEIVNLAPTETIKSVRFMGERAYVVTFRVVDPLFAIDLSEPTVPVVRGALKIPGFSNYLHPVGSNYLLGIGRDADEITGRLGPFQITLFDVSDLDHPAVADQVTFEGATWVQSEAWIDHHAVAFFEEAGVLAVPLAWGESVTRELDDGTTYESYERHEATWTFAVKTNGKAKLKATGKIEHPKPLRTGILAINPISITTMPVTSVWIPPQPVTPRPMQRAVRIENTLVTVSDVWLQVHKLNNPKRPLGQIHLGPPVADDRYTIDEDSGSHTFNVLANDPPSATNVSTTIVAVGDSIGGTVQIATTGQSVVFTPAEDFFGQASFTYTVDAPIFGEISARVNVYVRAALDDPTAVDDRYGLDISTETTEFDVLANDLNPDYTNGIYFSYSQFAMLDAIFTHPPAGNQGLVIAEVGAASSGASVEITDQGTVAYTPADGFVGVDTFRYAIRDPLDRMDTATVTVYVGIAPPLKEPIPTGNRVMEQFPEIEPLGEVGEKTANRLHEPELSVTPFPIDAVIESLFGYSNQPNHPPTGYQTTLTASDDVRIDPATRWADLVDRTHNEHTRAHNEHTGQKSPSSRRRQKLHDEDETNHESNGSNENSLDAGGLRESFVDFRKTGSTAFRP